MTHHANAASHSARLLAALIDCCCAAALFWAVTRIDLPFVEVELVTFWAATFLLATLASAHALRGQSPGKAVARLVVLSTEAGPLSRMRHAARESTRALLALAICFLFAALGVSSLVRAFAMSIAVVASFELLTQAMRTDRRSIADLLFRTRVVRLPPLQPHRAPAGPMYSATDAEFGITGRAPSRDA